MTERRLEFITRDNCGLCDEAYRRLSGPARLLRVPLDVRNVDGDATLTGFAESVPVVRDVAGTRLHAGPLGSFRAAWLVLRARLSGR